ncbi:MAG TPA: hypothetical protein VF765_01340 [Polyangiaceae bacterium]
MANQTFQEQPHPEGVSRPVHDERMLEAVGAGSAAEAIGGAAAVVLAIIGLAGGMPIAMMSIATIVLGGAILLDSMAIGGRYERLVRDTWGSDVRVSKVQLGTGLSAEALAGIAGVVLGILSLLGFMPETLCAIALIVFGGGLMLGSMARRRFNATSAAHYGSGASHTAMRALEEATTVAAGGEVLIGIGAVVLGILSLLGLYPVTLVLVGFLGVGGVVMLGGSVLGTKSFRVMHPAH